MNKYKILILAIACCLFLAACDGSDKQQKIGVVDVNRLMKDSGPGKEALKFIEVQQAALQSDLDKIQERLEKNPADETAMQELQKVYAISQQKIQAEGQNIVGALFDSIQRAMDQFRQKQGYVILVRTEALDSFDPALDVTNVLMSEVNKIKIDFAAISTAANSSSEDNKVKSEKPEAKPTETTSDAAKADEAQKPAADKAISAPDKTTSDQKPAQQDQKN